MISSPVIDTVGAGSPLYSQTTDNNSVSITFIVSGTKFDPCASAIEKEERNNRLKVNSLGSVNKFY